MFPSENSLSRVYGPRVFLEQHYPNYKSMCRLEFGAYCEVHNDPNPSNTMKERTTSAIALYPANNQQGGYYFMNIATGKLLSRYQWTEVPMPDSVINQINQRGRKDKQLKEDDTPPDMFSFSVRDANGLYSNLIDHEHDNSSSEPVHIDLEEIDETNSLPEVPSTASPEHLPPTTPSEQNIFKMNDSISSTSTSPPYSTTRQVPDEEQKDQNENEE